MNGTALYNMIQEAKSKNKAVKLLTNKHDGYKFIVEPEDEIRFEEGGVFRFRDIGIDLGFVIGAMIIDNYNKRQRKNWEDCKKETIYEIYPLKPGGIQK